MSDPTLQRNLARGLEQTRTIERPGASGFDTFYATGTFTPTLVGSTIAGTFTYDATNTAGTYTRIGNRVLFSGRVRITAIAVAPTGDLRITGLPFTSTTTGFNTAGYAAGDWQGLTLPAGYTQVGFLIPDALAFLNIRRQGSNVAVTNVQGGELVLVAGVAQFFFAGQYQV